MIKDENYDSNRRKFLSLLSRSSSGLIVSSVLFSKKAGSEVYKDSFTTVKKIDNIKNSNINNRHMFKLADLPYDFGALEPYIDARTLQIHHGKHHKAYVDNLNQFIKDSPDANEVDIKKVIIHNKDLKNESEVRIFNNAAQAYNHEFYWHCMKPNGGGHPDKSGRLYQMMKQMFDISNEDELVAKVNDELLKAALTQFGSGWGWLVYNKNSKKLEIKKTSNAGTPLTDNNLVPLLTVDVWEHAYYLSYQNRRQEYLEKFFGYLVNWDFAEKNLLNALSE